MRHEIFPVPLAVLVRVMRAQVGVIWTPVEKQFISDDNKISATQHTIKRKREKEAFPKKTKTKTKKQHKIYNVTY